MAILLAGILFSAVSLLGALVLLLPQKRFQQIVPLLVALAAGALLGGAFFHLLPESVAEAGSGQRTWLLLAGSFLFFFVLEQFLHWHHCHRAPLEHGPVGYNLLLSGGAHSLLEGIAIGSLLQTQEEIGLVALLLVLAHEVPQSLGDFGALVGSGWKPSRALFWNWVSALAFLPGALLGATLLGEASWMIPLVAGSFLYVGAADLLPQLRSHDRREQIGQFLFLLLGLAALFFL